MLKPISPRERISRVVFYILPSTDWMAIARRLSRCKGFIFSIVFPQKARGTIFRSLGPIVHDQGEWSVYGVVAGGVKSQNGEFLFSAEFVGSRVVRVRDLQNIDLKGVLGLQYADRLLDWFMGKAYAATTVGSVTEPLRLRPDDLIEIIDYRILD